MGDLPLYAHSRNDKGIRQELSAHLTTVARLSQAFGEKFGAGELAYWAGLCHDLGKASRAFQEYLAAPEKHASPGHSLLGAAIVTELLNPLAFAVAGHHAGLHSFARLKVLLKEAAASPALAEIKHYWPAIQTSATISTPEEDNLPEYVRQSRVRLELFLRMLFSALTDADFLDTEEHFSPEKSQQRRCYPSPTQLWQRFCGNQARLTGKSNNTLNRSRHEIYEACLQAAQLPQGIFSLTVPTGGGKTRSAMGFALQHMLKHGLDRVIVAIPYTSIIEQTADVYRDIFGEEAVLEHHSQAALLNDDESEKAMRARLASENWDAPIVVTTQVQLFESLFSNRSSHCRKLHNIVRSVLILDEVQTLPTRLLEPILDVLQQLVDQYRVTVVLSTATQPALQDGPFQSKLSNVREIINNPAHYFAALKRVDYELALDNPWSWQQVAARMREANACMAIVNTKRDALALLEALDDPAALHLSTLLCGAHRRDVLREVRRRLVAKETCRLVSTQVVEAGVDLDFPLVLRALGPLDRIIQAAGRCNREGRAEPGRVVIFQPAEGKLPPGSYKTSTDTTAKLLAMSDTDLHDTAICYRYFQDFYQAVTADEEHIQPLREQLNYPEVAQRFRLISDDTVSVIVDYHGVTPSGEPENLLALLRKSNENPRWLLRRLQPYMVNVRHHLLRQYERSGLVVPLIPHSDLYEWLGGYDSLRGLLARGLDPEALVI